MEALKDQEQARLDDLKALRSHVGQSVLSGELKKRERYFLKCLSELGKAAQAVNDGRVEIKGMLPDGQEYSPITLKISRPNLYEIQESIEDTGPLKLMA